MLNNLSAEIRECYRHAHHCARQAGTQTDPKLKQDFFDAEGRWLFLARSYEFTERLGEFSDDTKRPSGQIAEALNIGSRPRLVASRPRGLSNQVKDWGGKGQLLEHPGQQRIRCFGGTRYFMRTNRTPDEWVDWCLARNRIDEELKKYYRACMTGELPPQLIELSKKLDEELLKSKSDSAVA